jgi:hypothetical protein
VHKKRFRVGVAAPDLKWDYRRAADAPSEALLQEGLVGVGVRVKRRIDPRHQLDGQRARTDDHQTCQLLQDDVAQCVI